MFPWKRGSDASEKPTTEPPSAAGDVIGVARSHLVIPEPAEDQVLCQILHSKFTAFLPSRVTLSTLNGYFISEIFNGVSSSGTAHDAHDVGLEGETT
ncbi:hypothetical protein NDU88_009199 [Pleurodeles waltl]|uniref:Uncharacterized protein n=1 Tax=Pleurodeles waltl TaxID=8319 RepID=A0AAV7PRJ2_PLEWA|nr:hypothetical protein NDU88_009199 [Pleurodeles waltl]